MNFVKTLDRAGRSRYFELRLFLLNCVIIFSAQVAHVHRDGTPGGVLRYISDGDVRSPFLGLKFAI